MYDQPKKFVYIICDPANDLYKIGVTKNIYNKRMKQLQTGNGSELHIVKFHETYFPYRVEKYLHMYFSNKHERGEWYRLDIEDINQFDKLCEKYEEIIKNLMENPFFVKELR